MIYTAKEASSAFSGFVSVGIVVRHAAPEISPALSDFMSAGIIMINISKKILCCYVLLFS